MKKKNDDDDDYEACERTNEKRQKYIVQINGEVDN